MASGSYAPPHHHHPAAAAAAATCEWCSSPRIDGAWLAAFGVRLCHGCKAQEGGLISKSKAKATFLLTDADLGPLGSLTRDNPQHKSWGPMRMYLTSQVKAAALRKHGSLAEVEAKKDARASAKFSAAARKRGAAGAADEAERREVAFEAKVRARAEAARAEAAAREQREETVDPETGTRRLKVAPHLAETEIEEL